MAGDTRRLNYEKQVRALALVAQQLLESGWSGEQVARHVVAVRNRLKIIARRSDDSEIIALIEARNLKKYGHPVGPTADQLFARYRSWRAVIDAAARPAELS